MTTLESNKRLARLRALNVSLSGSLAAEELICGMMNIMMWFEELCQESA